MTESRELPLMITFPNAKINLGLHVVKKRTDGFHDIETLFYPIDLQDILEVVPAKRGTLNFTSTGLPIPGNPQDNLVREAIALFHRQRSNPLQLACYPVPNSRCPTSLDVYLHKVIPMGSGLGGGSSDAAFMLRLLNDLFETGYPVEKLLDMARELGSDCSFFLLNTPLFATGRGDRFIPFPLDLSAYTIRFSFPPVHVSTSQAYAMVTPRQPVFPLKDILSWPVDQWKGRLINDFEEPVMNRYPLIREARDTLYQEGALYAAMSGSGSAVFGIFPG